MSDGLSNEVQLMLAQANITQGLAETQHKQRSYSQMQEYLRVVNYRLDKEHMTETIDRAQSAQVSELLNCIHQQLRHR